MAKLPLARVAALVVVALSLAGCGHLGGIGQPALTERECMARVMYFESNRSSDDGMLAVGTVVMNRLESPKYPKSVCGVVGQPRQFADGALTNSLNKRHSSWARAERNADAVLSGERHAGVGSAMFFHTHGYTYPYRNMHYVTLAGGNVFYEKRAPGTFTPRDPNTMLAYRAPKPEAEPRIQLAAAEETAEQAAEPPAEPVRRRRQPVTLASSENARDTQPMRIAPRLAPAPVQVAEAPRPSPVRTFLPREQPIRESAPARPPVQVAAAALPPAKPRPIVLAMLDEPRPRTAPRSIADLIEMDLKQR